MNNSRLSRHVIAILAAEEADQARHVIRHARAAQQDQVLGVLLDRLTFLGAFLLAELFVDEIPHRLFVRAVMSVSPLDFLAFH